VADSGYLREIYEASYRRLVAQAYAVAGDRVEAEDAVQEAFARAVAGRRQVPARGQPRGLAADGRAERDPTAVEEARMFRLLSPKLATPTDVPGISEDHLAVVKAMRAVPLQQRETLALFYLADLSVQEIAATLRVADGTVKSRLNRGRTALAEQLRSTVEADRG
jgi:RNA polymerase sigma-70 factor (ECF subfamily)